MDKKKLAVANRFFKKYRRRFGGSWAGFRNRVYAKVVLGLSVEQYDVIPYSKRKTAPITWNLPSEYMVAYLRNVRGMTQSKAIEKVSKLYRPRAKK